MPISNKTGEAIRLAVELAGKQARLMFEIYQMNVSMLELLKAGTQPTPEQLVAWDEAHVQLNGRLIELHATLEALTQQIRPQFDS